MHVNSGMHRMCHYNQTCIQVMLVRQNRCLGQFCLSPRCFKHWCCLTTEVFFQNIAQMLCYKWPVWNIIHHLCCAWVSYIEHSLCMLLHMLPSNMWCNKYVMQYVFRVVVWFAWFFWKWMFSPGSVCIHIGVFNTEPKKQKRLLWHIFCDRAYKHKRCYTLVCVYSFFFFSA